MRNKTAWIFRFIKAEWSGVTANYDYHPNMFILSEQTESRVE